MLIDKHGIAVWIYNHETGGACAVLVCFGGQFHALRLELALEFAHIRELVELLGVAVPAGVKGQHIPLEHALKETYNVVCVLHDEPIL